MRPDPSKHDPRPEYLRALIDRAGISQQEAARLAGVSYRMMRYYLSRADDHRDAPYKVQFLLESLASP